MGEYITDKDGKKEVIGCFQLLYAGNESELYVAEREKEQQAQQEQEKLASLVPSDEEVRKAETELQIINLLREVKLI